MKHLDKVMYGAIAYGMGYGAGSGSLAAGIGCFFAWLIVGMLLENLIEYLKS